MRFWVSVPVLSQQMVVVEPSASTAGRWRTRALRLAMRCVAIASDSVTVGSRPSGTLATMMPMAKSRFSQAGSPSAWPMKKKATPSPVASAATMRESRAISRCSGELGSPTVCVRWAIFPNSVRMPVAYTIARAWPDTTEVPASTIFFANRSDSSLLGSVLRALGLDSPVTVAVFTRSAKASTSRQSAGTRFPSSSSTMSPGTRAVASISAVSPPRLTFTFCGSNWRSAATAFSALYSCQKEKMPLIRMTPTIAMPRRFMPWPGSKCSAMNASAAAAQRMMAKKCVNSRAKPRSRCSRSTSSTWLDPNSTSRRVASASSRPAGEVFRLARAWSAVSLWICTVEGGGSSGRAACLVS